MWERGLKPDKITKKRRDRHVAPHVGAWIETARELCLDEANVVAPHVGAWIETLPNCF